MILSNSVIDRHIQLFRLPSGLLDGDMEANPNIVAFQLNLSANSTVEISFSTDEPPITGIICASPIHVSAIILLNFMNFYEKLSCKCKKKIFLVQKYENNFYQYNINFMLY